MTEAPPEVTTEYVFYESALACDESDIQAFGKIFLPLFYIAVFALGLAGNVMVVLAIVKEGSKKSITDIYLMNLAVSDLLFVISIDRYLAIVRATYSMRSRTIKHSLLITCGVWATAVLVSVPHFVFSQMFENDCIPVLPQELMNIWPVFCNVELNTAGFFIPVCIICYCYCGIIKTLLYCKNQKKARAIKLTLAVVIVFFLFWTPYNVLIFLETLRHYELFISCNQIKSLDYAMHLTETIAFSHCCLNPLIYAFAGEKFRKYLHRVCFKYCPCLCFCGPCNHYDVRPSVSYAESMVNSNITLNTSDQDGTVFL